MFSHYYYKGWLPLRFFPPEGLKKGQNCYGLKGKPKLHQFHANGLYNPVGTKLIHLIIRDDTLLSNIDIGDFFLNANFLAF